MMQAELERYMAHAIGYRPKGRLYARRGMSGEVREAPDLCHAGRGLFGSGVMGGQSVAASVSNSLISTQRQLKSLAFVYQYSAFALSLTLGSPS